MLGKLAPSLVTGSMPVFVCVCSVVSSSLATPWTVAHQSPLSMGFPRKNIQVGCRFLLWGIFPTQGLVEPVSPALQADYLPPCYPGSP